MYFSYFYLTFIMLLVVDQPSYIKAVNISINPNISGLVGGNDTYLTCSFAKYVNRKFLNVAIVARNKAGEFDKENPIVLFRPEKAALVYPSVQYLDGRVTLTNITYVSDNATITFDTLQCEDEKDYICTLTYINNLDQTRTVLSETTWITVKVPPSIPNMISSFIVSPKKLEENKTDKSIDTVTQTYLKSTENPLRFVREGDTMEFTCKGNIGKPPGKLVWQMNAPQQDRPIMYFNQTTLMEAIPDKCNFRGTSRLTVNITVDHSKAKFRCFEETQADIPGMYVETEPLNVNFHVRHITIKTQPNQKRYDNKIERIILTCNGSGNPEPNYTWFKENNKRNILSSTNVYIIDNVIQNNSGVYTCEAYNKIDNEYHRNSTSVEIDIAIEIQPSPESSSLKIVLVYVIPVVCVVICIVTCVAVINQCCIKPKRKGKVESYCQQIGDDGITINPEYASVIHTKNDMEGNKNKSRNKQEDHIKTVDVNPNFQTTSFLTPVYAVPNDALQATSNTCEIPLGMTSFKD